MLVSSADVYVLGPNLGSEDVHKVSVPEEREGGRYHNIDVN